MTEAPKTPEIAELSDSKDLARRLFVAAAKYAAATLEDYRAAYPEQADALAAGQFEFVVRLDNMLSDKPRVSLCTLLQRVEVDGQLCAREIEVAHVLLSAPGPAALRH